MKVNATGRSFVLARLSVLADELNLKDAAVTVLARAPDVLGPTRAVDAAQAAQLADAFHEHSDERKLLSHVRAAITRMAGGPASSARHAGTSSLVAVMARAREDVAASLPVDYALVESQGILPIDDDLMFARYDGQRLCFGDKHGRIGILDFSDAAASVCLDASTKDEVDHIAVAPDGKSLVYLKDSIVVARSIPSGKKLFSHPVYNFTHVSFTGDSSVLNLRSSSRSIFSYSMVDGSAIPHESHRIDLFQPAAKGTVAAAITGNQIWSVQDATKPLGSHEYVASKLQSISSVALQAAGERAVCIDRERQQLQFFDMRTRKFSPQVISVPGQVACAALSDDGNHLALSIQNPNGTSGSVVIYDVQQQSFTRTSITSQVSAWLEWAPDGRSLASATTDHTILVTNFARQTQDVAEEIERRAIPLPARVLIEADPPVRIGGKEFPADGSLAGRVAFLRDSKLAEFFSSYGSVSVTRDDNHDYHFVVEVNHHLGKASSVTLHFQSQDGQSKFDLEELNFKKDMGVKHYKASAAQLKSLGSSMIQFYGTWPYFFVIDKNNSGKPFAFTLLAD